MKGYTEIDLSRIKTRPLKGRKSKVTAEDFARPPSAGGSLRDFLAGLPNILAGRDLREIAARTAAAYQKGRPVIFGMGAHVIKVGLGPVIIELMNRGVVSLLALNGAGMIHDVEIAVAGNTSEDVEEELETGRFGMARETAQLINDAINEGVSRGLGLGEAVTKKLSKAGLPFSRLSILAQAGSLGVPVTCHVAVGTDVIHMHPSMNGEFTGEGSFRDFKKFAAAVCNLQDGVYFNIGSAVLLPEVFIKAFSLARNLGHRVDRLTTVNMDFIYHYRPRVNVVMRPTIKGGKGYNLIGHHEIMVPLLASAILESVPKGLSRPIRGKD